MDRKELEELIIKNFGFVIIISGNTKKKKSIEGGTVKNLPEKQTWVESSGPKF